MVARSWASSAVSILFMAPLHYPCRRTRYPGAKSIRNGGRSRGANGRLRYELARWGDSLGLRVPPTSTSTARPGRGRPRRCRGLGGRPDHGRRSKRRFALDDQLAGDAPRPLSIGSARPARTRAARRAHRPTTRRPAFVPRCVAAPRRGCSRHASSGRGASRVEGQYEKTSIDRRFGRPAARGTAFAQGDDWPKRNGAHRLPVHARRLAGQHRAAARRQAAATISASPSWSTTAPAPAARSPPTTSPSRRPTATRCCWATSAATPWCRISTPSRPTTPSPTSRRWPGSARSPTCCAAIPSFPHDTLPKLIAAAKAEPGKY